MDQVNVDFFGYNRFCFDSRPTGVIRHILNVVSPLGLSDGPIEFDMQT